MEWLADVALWLLGTCIVILSYIQYLSCVGVWQVCAAGGAGAAPLVRAGGQPAAVHLDQARRYVKTLIKMTPHVSTLVFFLSRHPSGGQENVFSFFYSRTQLPFVYYIFIKGFTQRIKSLINLIRSLKENICLFWEWDNKFCIPPTLKLLYIKNLYTLIKTCLWRKIQYRYRYLIFKYSKVLNSASVGTGYETIKLLTTVCLYFVPVSTRFLFL